MASEKQFPAAKTCEEGQETVIVNLDGVYPEGSVIGKEYGSVRECIEDHVAKGYIPAGFGVGSKVHISFTRSPVAEKDVVELKVLAPDAIVPGEVVVYDTSTPNGAGRNDWWVMLLAGNLECGDWTRALPEGVPDPEVVCLPEVVFEGAGPDVLKQMLDDWAYRRGDWARLPGYQLLLLRNAVGGEKKPMVKAGKGKGRSKKKFAASEAYGVLDYEDYKEAVEGEGWAIGDYRGMLGEAETKEEREILGHILEEEEEHMDELQGLMFRQKVVPEEAGPEEVHKYSSPDEVVLPTPLVTEGPAGEVTKTYTMTDTGQPGMVSETVDEVELRRRLERQRSVGGSVKRPRKDRPPYEATYSVPLPISIIPEEGSRTWFGSDDDGTPPEGYVEAPAWRPEPVVFGATEGSPDLTPKEEAKKGLAEMEVGTKQWLGFYRKAGFDPKEAAKVQRHYYEPVRRAVEDWFSKNRPVDGRDRTVAPADIKDVRIYVVNEKMMSVFGGFVSEDIIGRRIPVERGVGPGDGLAVAELKDGEWLFVFDPGTVEIRRGWDATDYVVGRVGDIKNLEREQKAELARLTGKRVDLYGTLHPRVERAVLGPKKRGPEDYPWREYGDRDLVKGDIVRIKVGNKDHPYYGKWVYAVCSGGGAGCRVGARVGFGGVTVYVDHMSFDLDETLAKKDNPTEIATSDGWSIDDPGFSYMGANDLKFASLHPRIEKAVLSARPKKPGAVQKKRREVGEPYEVWKTSDGSWEWRVLKKYQTPEMEALNPYARWYCAVKSPATYGEWEYGDVYVKDVKSEAVKFFDEMDETTYSAYPAEAEYVRAVEQEDRVAWLEDRISDWKERLAKGEASKAEFNDVASYLYDQLEQLDPGNRLVRERYDRSVPSVGADAVLYAALAGIGVGLGGLLYKFVKEGGR